MCRLADNNAKALIHLHLQIYYFDSRHLFKFQIVKFFIETANCTLCQIGVNRMLHSLN